MQIVSFLVAALAAGTATAHMNMKDPPPLAYKGNPNAKDPNIDYSITSPLSGASQFPCKGYLKLLGTPEGASVKTYAPGGQYTMSVEGGAYHNGGSCQLSLSYDQGKTFKVIKSFIGNCPTASGGTFGFDVPADAPEGDEVVFAWTWVNNTGNREFYMSCAVVSIKAGGAKRELPAANMKRGVAFSDRPDMFVANLGGEYCTAEGVDTVYPEPGPDVEDTSTKPGAAKICATGADAPMGDTSGSGGSGSAPAPSASSASAPSASSAPAQQPSSAVEQPTQAVPSLPGGVFVTQPPASNGEATPTPAPTPSTLSTAIIPGTSAGASSAAPAPTPSSPAGSPVNPGTPTSSAKTPTSTGGAGAGAGAQSGACSNEGAWACAADGSSFQRCAAGQWSQSIPMASGTKCTPGVSDSFQMGRARRSRVRRAANI
ncbi:uncharacterized protein F4812DRAFT_171007 [Daldinia caldariorum]|uniref:uncharacterized protein n=1 Tax=Daldinia caldariorum TaxID=326644 RepID=UPI0020078B8F|nr:uncharacterized protein F4812DRAFT_171007 [Daldinia caldariorum]KAI1471235.1 hypothetical protein F4812DRAFT_171007 [Daldinia caldariorum]